MKTKNRASPQPSLNIISGSFFTDAKESLLLTLIVTLPLGVAWETPSEPKGQMVIWFWLP